MQNETLYTSFKGVITGPFTRIQLIQLFQAGQIGKHHLVSIDRVNWKNILSLEWLIKAVEIPLPVNVEQVTTRNFPESSNSQTKINPPKVIMWHTSRAGKVYGPYTSAQLQSFAKTGELIPNDMICTEGSNEWKRAGDMNALFPAPPTPDSPTFTQPTSAMADLQSQINGESTPSTTQQTYYHQPVPVQYPQPAQLYYSPPMIYANHPNNMYPPSFTGKAVTALLLYLLFWLPGVVATYLFYSEARTVSKRYRMKPEGYDLLCFLHWLNMIILCLVVLGLFFVVVILGTSSCSGSHNPRPYQYNYYHP